MKRIFFAEDDLSLIGGLTFALKKQGYETEVARTSLEARRIWKDGRYDLVILDVSLPDGSGYDLCRFIRETSKVPIIFLTAADEETDIIMGLDIGGDDYITKPFSMPIVLKHIEAVLRRAEQGAGVETNILRYKDLTLDTDSFTVLVKDESVSLTIREFEILKLLVENQGRVFTRESLLDSIWGYDYFGDEKIVNTHIKNIRKKLGVDYIETIRGAGYKIEKEN